MKNKTRYFLLCVEDGRNILCGKAKSKSLLRKKRLEACAHKVSRLFRVVLVETNTRAERSPEAF